MTLDDFTLSAVAIPAVHIKATELAKQPGYSYQFQYEALLRIAARDFALRAVVKLLQEKSFGYSKEYGVALELFADELIAVLPQEQEAKNG